MKNKKQTTAIICLSPNDGGMELDTIKLAKNLHPYIDVLVIAKENSFISQQIQTQHTIKLETVSFLTTLNMSLILQLRKIINDYNIKNIIFFGASELKSLYFSLFRIDVNLIIRHGTTKSKPKKDIFHKLIYSNVNYHISISEHILKNVEYIIPFGKNTKEKLIYSSFKTTSAPQHITDKISLLHVGRIVEGKGQIDAIKACEILISNNIPFEFNIVGSIDSNYQKTFLEFYNNCPYKNSIHLVGFTNNVSNYLKKANIFLFPSYGEGLGNAFLEALSSNLICISYNNTIFPELAKLGLNFFMAKNKNINDLKKQLLYAVKHINIKKKKIKENRSIIKKVFSIDREVQQYLDILK